MIITIFQTRNIDIERKEKTYYYKQIIHELFDSNNPIHLFIRFISKSIFILPSDINSNSSHPMATSSGLSSFTNSGKWRSLPHASIYVECCEILLMGRV